LILSFPTAEGPRWVKGFSVNLGMNLLAVTLALCMTTCQFILPSSPLLPSKIPSKLTSAPLILVSLADYRYENRRRDKAEGGPPAHPPTDCSEHFDKTVGYRYTV
jgi:hypothetical protein